MAGIEGVGNKGIDWKVMLESVAGAGNVDGTENTRQRGNLVLNEKDRQVLLNLLTTPDIEAPKTEENPAAKLGSLIDKLKDGKTFDFTEEQTRTFMDTLNAVLAKVNATDPNYKVEAPAGGVVKPKKASQVLFDIYAMMALVVECAQEQKNAQREVRQSEVTSLISSIQNQADKQKSAALTGLIAGSIICGMQACAAGYSAYKTVSNVKVESNLSQEFGVKGAATELSTAKSTLQTDTTALKEFETQNPPPAPDAQPNAEIEQQRTTLQEKVAESKKIVMEKNQQLKLSRAVMGASDEFMDLKKSEAFVKGFADLSMALGNLGQTLVRGFVDIQQAEAMSKAADQKKEENALEETKEIINSFQELMEQVLQLAQAILQAENESMRSAIQA